MNDEIEDFESSEENDSFDYPALPKPKGNPLVPGLNIGGLKMSTLTEIPSDVSKEKEVPRNFALKLPVGQPLKEEK